MPPLRISPHSAPLSLPLPLSCSRPLPPQEGEATDLEEVQEEYIARWEAKNKQFVTDFESGDATQTVIGEMIKASKAVDAASAGGAPRLHARHGPVMGGLGGAGAGQEQLQEIFAKALMLDPAAVRRRGKEG